MSNLLISSAPVTLSSCIPSDHASRARLRLPQQGPSQTHSRAKKQDQDPYAEKKNVVDPTHFQGHGPLVFPVDEHLRRDITNNKSSAPARSKSRQSFLYTETALAPILLSSHFYHAESDSTDEASTCNADQNFAPSSLEILSSKSYWHQVTTVALVDVLHILVARSVPQNLVRMQLRRYERRQIVLWEQKQSHPAAKFGNLPKQARGIRNYGQTCFLNSILQALASLEPFLVYLERLTSSARGASNAENALHMIKTLMLSINGQVESSPDPRRLLKKVGKKHRQFFLGTGIQQDAEEMLQAIMSMVIADSNLSRTSSQVSSEPTFSLSSLLAKFKEEGFAPKTETASIKKEPCSSTRSESDLIVDIGEEKKQEEGLLWTSSAMNLNDEGFDHSALLIVEDDPNSSSCGLDSISTTTPSPLNGWLGETLRCADCGYSRPIHNQPFIDIPVIPTAVSKYLRSGLYAQQPGKGDRTPAIAGCSLARCLEDFIATERVRGVECRNCTIQKEIESLDEDVFMLQGAISSLLKQKKEPYGLQKDLEASLNRIRFLKQLDPDRVDTIPSAFRSVIQDHESKLYRADAFKALYVTRPPSVLCIHVQRRFYDPLRDAMNKTNQHVYFDEILDLGRFCAHTNEDQTMLMESGGRKHVVEVLYKLTSVIEHQGNAYGGHYVTYRRDPARPEKWLVISDEIIRELSWKELKSKQAYMLFYEAI